MIVVIEIFLVGLLLLPVTMNFEIEQRELYEHSTKALIIGLRNFAVYMKLTATIEKNIIFFTTCIDGAVST